jgi:hypothetical protein
MNPTSDGTPDGARDNNIDDCLLCIDALIPAGIHPVFGPVYRICPACYLPCAGCGGDGIWPADLACFDYLNNALHGLGFRIVLCGQCEGVLDIHPVRTHTER